MGVKNLDRIRDFDEERKLIEVEPYSIGRITGSRIAAILGLNDYNTPFQAACEIFRIYSTDPTPFTRAGTEMEPIIRNYLRKNVDDLISEEVRHPNLSVVDPVPAADCYFEHFPDAKPFGGLVDGYITSNGKNVAVLEVKTASNRNGWFDENEKEIVPTSYILQTSLYCELAKLDTIVFIVAFPSEKDYEDPHSFKPGPNNTTVRVVKPIPMKGYMREAKAWYEKYIMHHVTPPWDEKRDKELLKKFLEEKSNGSYY